MDTEKLIQAGVNYEAGIKRLMNNAALYDKLLRTLVSGTYFEDIKKAFDANDSKALYAAVHTLKGVSGNLSVTPLYEACCAVLELLRGQSSAGVPEGIAKVDAAYQAVQGAVQEER